ncbi:Rhamnolipids biosynthesis 3-oxoacyl-(acyl-carrier-protein) reductase [Penicillium ucsense]|uniref:Rhamnolipids biosynthesis 3-oxoacyl-(Acyl-carrier-protein) reductase n=1 Tax=Penicillium ucsense TaxID=2839758 RepID=A0A8J8WND3_9EURO|nr:Rhamnolipids biosynthesis 3-oxoacyl-(acyl-carrier-protein) reductase [Penicillium ucsense]KAF7739394.1 Rhamnolipids biosynthesis 3-oxoacyl-(acyl-carrier-protein) reductase [Penicillium ucsense]
MAHLEASNLFSVKERVVVITGGGSGLGRIMARALAINGASKVFVLGRREDALRETAAQAPEGIVIPVKCDITSKESLESAYQAVAEQTTHVDILFANGGILGPLMRSPDAHADGTPPSLTELRDALFNVPMEEFTRVLNVNVTGTYYTVLAFLPLLEAANKRRPAPQEGVLTPPSAQVVITSSIAGFVRKVPFSYAYNASKASTNQLVKLLSTNLADYKIRVNGLVPGLYDSEMANNIFVAHGHTTGGVSEGSFPKEMIPLTRGGSEEDFAGLIVWLASNSAGYVNGNLLVTDGGRMSVVPNSY